MGLKSIAHVITDKFHIIDSFSASSIPILKFENKTTNTMRETNMAVLFPDLFTKIEGGFKYAPKTM